LTKDHSVLARLHVVVEHRTTSRGVRVNDSLGESDARAQQVLKSLDQGHVTRRGKRWNPMQVSRVLKRAA